MEQRTRPNTDVQLILESRWNSIHINPNHVVDQKLIFKKNSFHETKTHSREQQWSPGEVIEVLVDDNTDSADIHLHIVSTRAILLMLKFLFSF